MTIYKERDGKKRQKYLSWLERIDGHRRVYIDESGIESRIMREYGYSKRGVKILGRISGKRGKRISIIAGKVGKKIIAPLRFEGYTNSLLFESYVEKVLAPELEKGQVVIMDNASFHKSKRVRELIKGAGCQLFFYQPILQI